MYFSEYTSVNLRRNWSQDNCVQAALNAICSSLTADQSQLINLADKPDVYSLLLQILCPSTPGQSVKLMIRVWRTCFISLGLRWIACILKILEYIFISVLAFPSVSVCMPYFTIGHCHINDRVQKNLNNFRKKRIL